MVALALLASAGSTAAQPLDPSSQDVLSQTLQILLDPNARAAELAKNPQGATVDQQVRALTGSDALTQEFYAVAGQVSRREALRQKALAGGSKRSRCEASPEGCMRGIVLTQPSPRGCAPQLELPRTLSVQPRATTKQMGLFQPPA